MPSPTKPETVKLSLRVNTKKYLFNHKYLIAYVSYISMPNCEWDAFSVAEFLFLLTNLSMLNCSCNQFREFSHYNLNLKLPDFDRSNKPTVKTLQ